MAKACGEWDVDKLEKQIPDVLVVEWNEYLNWEIAQWTQAILGALPADSRPQRLTDPEEIAGFLDALQRK